MASAQPGQAGTGAARGHRRLLTDAGLNRRLQAAGRAWIEAHYAWQAVYHRVDEVYARLLSPE